MKKTIDPTRRAAILSLLQIGPSQPDSSQPGSSQPGSSHAEALLSLATPPRPRPVFLPGERRSNVGVDGFKPIDPDRLTPRAYLARLSASPEPRNLTPPQHLTPSGQISSERIGRLNHHGQRMGEVTIGSDPHPFSVFPCTDHTQTIRRRAMFDHYRASFISHILSSHYANWRLGPWSWSQLLSGAYPLSINL